jgi:hypothetical protein
MKETSNKLTMNQKESEHALTIYQQIIADLEEREAMGVRKYGTSVDDAMLTQQQWMQHAYEEALDFAVYLKKMMSNDRARQV